MPLFVNLQAIYVLPRRADRIRVVCERPCGGYGWE